MLLSWWSILVGRRQVKQEGKLFCQVFDHFLNEVVRVLFGDSQGAAESSEAVADFGFGGVGVERSALVVVEIVIAVGVQEGEAGFFEDVVSEMGVAVFSLLSWCCIIYYFHVYWAISEKVALILGKQSRNARRC